MKRTIVGRPKRSRIENDTITKSLHAAVAYYKAMGDDGRDESDAPSPTDPPLTDAALIDRVLAFRRKHGLTQIDFARIYHLEPRTVQNWETGERKKLSAANRAFLQSILAEPCRIAKILQKEPV